MNRVGHPFLSLAAPFLIILGLLGLFYRQGSDRQQSFPALFVGAGLVVSRALGRGLQRKKLFLALRKSTHDDNQNVGQKLDLDLSDL